MVDHSNTGHSGPVYTSSMLIQSGFQATIKIPDHSVCYLKWIKQDGVWPNEYQTFCQADYFQPFEYPTVLRFPTVGSPLFLGALGLLHSHFILNSYNVFFCFFNVFLFVSNGFSRKYFQTGNLVSHCPKMFGTLKQARCWSKHPAKFFKTERH